MTNTKSIFNIELKSDNDVWDDWIMRSKNSDEFSMKKNAKNLVFGEGLLCDEVIISFKDSERLKILNLILNHCDNEKPRNIPLRIALEILSNMKPTEIRESQHEIEYDGSVKSIFVAYAMYKVEDFLKKVDEYLYSHAKIFHDRWHPYLTQDERDHFIKSIIVDEKVFLNIMIDDPNHPECKEILKLIITHWGSEEHEDLSLERVLIIISEMEPIESYDSEEEFSTGIIIVRHNWYDIEEFFEKVDEHEYFLQ